MRTVYEAEGERGSVSVVEKVIKRREAYVLVVEGFDTAAFEKDKKGLRDAKSMADRLAGKDGDEA